jgi:hypothetical protein
MQAYKEIAIDYTDVQSKAKVINFTRSGDSPLRKSVIVPSMDRTRGLTLLLRKYLVYLYIFFYIAKSTTTL